MFFQPIPCAVKYLCAATDQNVNDKSTHLYLRLHYKSYQMHSGKSRANKHKRNKISKFITTAQTSNQKKEKMQIN